MDDSRNDSRPHDVQPTITNMTSLKRSLAADPYASNISSKVYVRSTKSGKVQKIVRELYLRQDIPCASKLCATCLETAPRDAGGHGSSHAPQKHKLQTSSG